MAITKIAINTGILQSDITALENAILTVKNKMENMFTNMKAMDNMWKGTAHDAFMVQFTNDYNSMKDLCDILTNLLDNIKTAKKEYEQCEDSINTIINDIQISSL